MRIFTLMTGSRAMCFTATGGSDGHTNFAAESERLMSYDG
jgi:hypothetical protein